MYYVESSRSHLIPYISMENGTLCFKGLPNFSSQIKYLAFCIFSKHLQQRKNIVCQKIHMLEIDNYVALSRYISLSVTVQALFVMS